MIEKFLCDTCYHSSIKMGKSYCHYYNKYKMSKECCKFDHAKYKWIDEKLKSSEHAKKQKIKYTKKGNQTNLNL